MTTKPRKYQDGPEDVMLNTKWGRIRLHVNGADTMYLDANSNSGMDIPEALFLTVRGVEYGCSAHLVYVGKDQHYADGSLAVKQGWRVAPGNWETRLKEGVRVNWNWRSGLYANRRGNFKDVSDAARRALLDIFEQAANDWMADSSNDPAAAMLDAEVASLHNANRSDEEKLAELEKQMKQLERSICERDQLIAKVKVGRMS